MVHEERPGGFNWDGQDQQLIDLKNGYEMSVF